MAELAIAAIGSAIGGSAITGTVLGMSGAQIGWMAGSIAASLLFPPKGPDGPRLSDLSVQASTYGQTLNFGYGTTRHTGQVIWAADLVEHEHEQGKGGPSYSTFTYTCSFAVSFGAGEIDGYLRLWAGGKLIYSATTDNTGPLEDFRCSSYTMYLGTETQGVDPTMQAHLGDVPAYLGQHYIVFADLELEKFGNALPQITAEIVRNGTLAVPPPVVIGNGAADGAFDPESGYFWSHDTFKQVYVHDVYAGQQVRSFTALPGASTIDNINGIAYFPARFASISYITLQPRRMYLGVGKTTYFGGVAQGGYLVSADGYAQMGPVYISGSAVASYGGAFNAAGRLYAPADPSSISTGIYAFGEAPAPDVEPAGKVSISGIGDWTSQIFQCGDTGYAAAVLYGTTDTGVTIIDLSTDQVVFKSTCPAFSAGAQTAGYDSLRHQVLHVKKTAVTTAYVVDIATRTTTAHTVPSTLVCPVYHAKRDSWFVGTNDQIYELDPVTLATRTTISISGYQPQRLYTVPDASGFILVTTTANVLLKVFVEPRLTPAAVPLADIVSDISERVGLAPADIDVSDLTDTVLGYEITRQGAARSAIEPLMMGFSFNAVESEGAIKYVKRGAGSVLTIPADDLCAHEPGSDMPPPLALTRGDEVELPRVLTIKYSNQEADYQTGAQSAIRQIGRAAGESTMELPIVMTDAQAKAVADAAMYSAWTARTTATWRTTRKYDHLEPTDVVEVDGVTLYITSKSLQGNIIEWSGSVDSGQVFAVGAVAPGGQVVPQTTLPYYGNAGPLYLDIPMLRDTDNDAGFYVAVAGYNAAWPGGVIYKSRDDGESYDSIATMTDPATIGSATTALADFSENVLDVRNTVTVLLRYGELSSVSLLAMLNGSNAALLGSEIIQYTTATLNVDGTYTLSGLLRGRKGTPTSGHAVGDRFLVLNTTTLRRHNAGVDDIGLARLYKAVTFGATIASASETSFTNTAAGLECLSPVHLGGGRDAAGNLTINWVRRTRLGGEWRDYVDAPLGESAETYEVDIYNSTYTTLKRTISVTSQSASYTAAQQATDFGSAQATVYCRVYQTNTTTGRGSVLQGSI